MYKVYEMMQRSDAESLIEINVHVECSPFLHVARP